MGLPVGVIVEIVGGTPASGALAYPLPTQNEWLGGGGFAPAERPTADSSAGACAGVVCIIAFLSIFISPFLHGT
jgi:hypothetical protein